MANIDAGSDGEWLRWSDDALTSETGDDRDRATLRIINECSKPLHVQWVTSDGKLKNRRRVAPGKGRYAILDTLVLGIQPEPRVKASMNEIEMQKRLKLAQVHQAEAQKAIDIKLAEARAEARAQARAKAQAEARAEAAARGG